MIDTVSGKCENVPGDIGIKIRQKLNAALRKNEGFKAIREVKKIFECKFSIEVLRWLCSLQYCPLTSVDVERTFSKSKHNFTTFFNCQF